MSDYLPKFKPGQALTFTASTAVVGGRVVEVTGDRTVGHAGANSIKVVGYAGHDAAAGERVTVHRGGVQHPTASGAIGVGAPVYPAANGLVTATAGTGPRLGVSLAAAADAASVDVATD